MLSSNSSRWLIYVINSIDNTKLPYARFGWSPVFLVTLVAITETRGRMCDDKVEWKRGKWLLPSLLQRGLSLLINFRFFLINKAYQFRNLIHGSRLIITDPQPYNCKHISF